MPKTTLTLGNSFFKKSCAFVFEKIAVFEGRLVSSKKFNFSMAVFQASMNMLQSA